MKSWARGLLACWSATSTPPTTTTTVPNNAGPICCETSTTSPSTPMCATGPARRRDRAEACTHPQAKRRRTAQVALEPAICQPFLDDPSATHAKLCRRIERHINSSSSWRNPKRRRTTTPPSAACATWCSRKISGGTRSEQGTESKMTLASIFGTWRAQGLPLTACRQLLVSPLPPGRGVSLAPLRTWAAWVEAAQRHSWGPAVADRPTVSRRKWAAPLAVLARPSRSRDISTSPVPAAIARSRVNYICRLASQFCRFTSLDWPRCWAAGPVAGDVKLDDGVVHDPVNRRGGGHGVGKDALPLREDQV